MTDPTGLETGRARSRVSLSGRLTRPVPVWGRYFSAPPWAIGVALGLVAWSLPFGNEWWWPFGNDPTPRRWSLLFGEPESQLYKTRSDPASQRDDPCKQTIDWRRPHAAVYSVKATPHPLPTLRDLGDRAQAKAIDFLETDPSLRGKSLSELRDALSESQASTSGEKDPFQFDRVLVATVAKGLKWDPGDRMMWTRIFVQPINFSFGSYTVASTDNETIRVANLETTNSRKVSADIGLTVPELEGAKASVDPGFDHTVKATSDVNAQYERLGVDILPDFLRIVRESETGGDVVGNTMISLTAVTDPKKIREHQDYEGCLIDPPRADDLVLLVTGTHLKADGTPGEETDSGAAPPRDQKQAAPLPPIDVLPEVPVPHCALRARVWMLYEWRKVEHGRASYSESKQWVDLERDAEDYMDVDVVSADDVSPNHWALRICKWDCSKEPVRLLQASVEGGGILRDVLFPDYGKAVKVAHWLRRRRAQSSLRRRGTQATASDSLNYKFNYDAASKEALVPVKKTRDECRLGKTSDLGKQPWE
jgi:hypothetical protein